MSGKKYVIRTMKAKCDQGTMENYLNVDTGHGVLYDGQPVLNANDHIEHVNLTPFGDCKSKAIYIQAQKEILSQMGEGLIPALGAVVKEIFLAASFVTSIFKKCEMSTPTRWVSENRDYRIDGAGALTMESKCACRYGGTISIVVELEETSGES